MIPETVGALLGFVLFVVPGMAFELLRQRRRPSWPQTNLEEAVRITLASIALEAVAVGLIRAVALAWPTPFVSLATLAREGASMYWRGHYAAVLLTVGLVVVVGVVLAALVHRSLSAERDRGWAKRVTVRIDHLLRHTPGQLVERSGVWRSLFRERRPLGADTQLAITKTDGSMWMGRLAAYSLNDEPDSHIALEQPITVLRNGQQATLDSHWLLVIIAGADISEILVTYPPTLPSE